ncbi:MAG TPA: GMC oxidoreductase [Microbacterium sp.]|uniref:GMC oxidoreductase n=1 Tax=Microbacterium sp. TaxID=51671 RepID=UPI002CC7F6D6|nr:GMC oxidoreductase [Microbacterium sp.]HWI30743.1 GMC oxidoreductase [Microbacterium sp.]
MIGSGPIGATYARRILEGDREARVLMVDVGPEITARPGMNVRNIPEKDVQDAARIASQGPRTTGVLGGGVPGGPPPVEGTFTARQGTHLIDDGGEHSGHAAGMPAAAVATNVGGQGAHWTCATPRPVDNERVDFIDDDEWEDLITEAEQLLHVKKDIFTSPITDAITRRLSQLFDEGRAPDRRVGTFPVAVDIEEDGSLNWVGTDTVLGPLIDSSSLLSTRFELRPRTQAVRLLFDGARVRGAVVREFPDGDEYEVSADAIVVAADAIRTPQLLFASGIRPPALGRYLTEHPIILSMIAIRDDLLDDAADTDHSDRAVFSTALGDAVTAAVRIPYIEETFPTSSQIMHMTACPFPIPEDNPLAKSKYGYAAVGFGGLKFPRAEDGLVFSSEETDVFGMPNVTIEYELTPAEQELLESAKLAQAKAISALGQVVPGGEPRVAPPGSSLHYMGTFRTGPEEDGTSVVDPWSRVWGFDNLFLGGNGTIPTVNVVNPTLYSVALALRGARTLVRQLTAATTKEVVG